jgi:probable F420-dependent oxidoreductase
MAERVTISTALSNCREGRLHPIGVVTVDWLREVGRRAEQLGYDSLWLNEFGQTEPNVAKRFADPPAYFDPLITIAAVAEETSRIRFVTSTIVLPLHDPLMLAKRIVTLEHFTQGRITLGIGLGGSAEEFKQLRGELDVSNRGELMDEYLAALRLLWTERYATYDGRYVKLNRVEQYPKPIQNPVPIYMAGSAAGVFRRLVRFGQGWIDTFLQPAAIADVVRQIAELMSAAGRDDQVAVTRQFYLSIGETGDAAVKNYEASLPGAPLPQPPAAPEDWEMSIMGTPDDVAERIQTYVSAGVTEVCAIFYAPDLSTTLAQMELFSKEVAPRLVAA